MTKCTHCETCEECFEANRKLRAESSLRNGLVSSIRDELGVSHLKGNAQLEAALAEIRRLKYVVTATALEGASPIG